MKHKSWNVLAVDTGVHKRHLKVIYNAKKPMKSGNMLDTVLNLSTDGENIPVNSSGFQTLFSSQDLTPALPKTSKPTTQISHNIGPNYTENTGMRYEKCMTNEYTIP